MRRVASGILFFVMVGSAVAAPRQRVVTMFNAVQFVDGPTPQSAQAVISTGKFGHVTMVSQLTDVTNPQWNVGVTCTFTMAETLDPATTLSVTGFAGTIGREAFVYAGDVGAITAPTAVLGPYLLCRTAPVSGAVGSKLTLKAVFTK